MTVAQAQAYQTIPTPWVARELLILPSDDNAAFLRIGDRCWTSDLPENEEFNNSYPACVVTDAGSDESKRNNTIYVEGVMVFRIFGGSNRLTDCHLAWHDIKTRLTEDAKSEEITVPELNVRARWLWAHVIATTIEVRKHPATGWPELNCSLEYALQGIAKET